MVNQYFKFQPNTCLDCTDQPTHSNCQEPAQGNYTATPPQPTAPAEPVPPSFESTLPHEKNAPVSTPESPSPQSPNVTKDPGDSGKPRRKFSLTDILISVIVTVIVICITVRLWYACKKRGLVCSTSSSTLEIKSYLEVATDDKTGSACSSPLASGSRSFCGPSTSDPQLVYDPFQGAGVPVGLTLDPQSSDVTNKDASLPGLLRSNGGPGGDQEVYQNQHRSLELERDDLADYFSEGPAASAATAADDDGDGDDDANAEDDSSDPISQPLPLMP
nr:uncharacterized protein LOC129260700 [Lytechinus pictus]